jgi:glycosyltransferase involved in cell wall biosynthesis
MKILLTADGRSPITRGWVRTLLDAGCEVSLVSTFPCPPVDGVTEQVVIPAAFSSMAGSQAGGKASGKTSRVRGFVSQFRNLFMAGRYWLGPVSLGKSRRAYLDCVDRIKPDVAHALRIPFEGMLARVTPVEIPFIVSIWGNDLTLHAHGSPLMARETRLTLQRANGLMADAHRDLRLGSEWGLRPTMPTLCIPGGGGIDLKILHTAICLDVPLPVDLPLDVPVVINPRGFRPGSVRNDTFFKAIPLVLQELPETIFICAGMADQPEALQWLQRLGIESSVRLLPFLPQEDLWRLFKRAQVTASISQHDGTPNSLLEAMALGCYPVVGDIESTREWIKDGQNGRLVDPEDASAIAAAILDALKSPTHVEEAAILNRGIIHERADRQGLLTEVNNYYQTVIQNGVRG